MEQLREFNESLSKMISGDMTLVDQLGSMHLVSVLEQYRSCWNQFTVVFAVVQQKQISTI